jgi:predicted lipoprotein with Yx(FWY)xxD motif
MKRSTKLAAVAAPLLAIVALAAGCGGSSGTASSGGSHGNNSHGYGYGGNPSGTTSKAGSAGAGVARIAVEDSSLGRILVNGQGRTVYLFEKDTGKASTCYGACANVWRPVTTSGAPKAGKEAIAGMLGTSKRRNGTLQVTYNRHPLYTYAGDAKSGQTNGQGSDEFGAEWYVLSPAGNNVESGGS